MKTWMSRRGVLCGLAVGLVCALLAGGAVHAQGAQFSQRERVKLAMDNSPELVVAAIESVLTQAQIAGIESALFPEPTEAEQRTTLESVKVKLLQAGFAADDPLVKAVDARAGAIVGEAPVAQE